MNAITLAIASIRSRPLHAGLCTAASAAGIALLCAVFLLSQAVATGFTRNAQGIDLVAGAKGSPLQLVLSAVYQADIPAGNIDMSDFETLRRNRHVRHAIPLALGDNYKGFRMVGTTPDYLALYHAEFASGGVFKQPFDTVAGADTGLKLGDKFAVSHGFSANSDDLHDYRLYTITGVLKPTGTVLDKLLTTQVESVQQLHAHHDDAQAHEHDAGTHKEDPAEAAAEAAMAHQVTAVLIKVRSPIDLLNLPREINRNSNIMAAVPSFEMAKLTENLGIGRQLVLVLGAGFVLLSALMLMASLASGLALRRYDLAVMRVLGASPFRLSATVIAEAMILSGIGALLGIVLGHGVAFIAASSLDSLRGVIGAGMMIAPQVMDLGFLFVGLIAGLLAALIPSVTAARTDIAGLLARGRA